MRNRTPLTADIAAQIKALAAYSDLHQHEIASRLGSINQGRVSEVLSGKRYSSIPPASRNAVIHLLR